MLLQLKKAKSSNLKINRMKIEKKNHIILFSQIKEDCKIYYISPISEEVILRLISFQIDIRSEIQKSACHYCNIVTLNINV